MRLFGADLLADPSRQVERKIKEAILALRLDDRYSGTEGKQRIVEMYLNQVYYGNNAYGIWAAASAYFGKDLTSDGPGRPAHRQRGGDAGRAGARAVTPRPTPEAVQEERRRGATVYVVPPTAQAIVVRDFVLDQMLDVRLHHARTSTTRPIAERGRPGPAADNAVPGAALRLRGPARGERAARGRGGARHRRAAHLHHPRLRGLPGAPPRSGRRSPTTWIV